jgi:predicted RNA-binding Zn-ribbon protein involved in translation (DUF1610 family)
MKAAAAGATKEREEKLPKECPECHFMKPSGVYVCPKCGFKPLVGQDVETDGTRNIKKMSKHETVYTKSDKQSWWSQIKFYQRHRAAQETCQRWLVCSYLSGEIRRMAQRLKRLSNGDHTGGQQSHQTQTYQIC